MGRCATIAKGTVVRLLFAVLAGVSVWVVSGKDARLWLLWVAFGLLTFMEGAYVLGVRKHGSWKWFSPTIAVLLLCTVPCLWIIELDIYAIYRECDEANISCDRSMFNLTSVPTVFGQEMSIPLEMPLTDWSLILHQMLLFALILGRWLLPKGEMSRDQLSQLLLVQIGMAADILEFVTEGLKAEEIFENELHVYVLLTVWTWSLPQFTLSLTLTKGRKRRAAGIRPISGEFKKGQRPKRMKTGEEHLSWGHFCCGTEVWAILVTLMMQDVPFLATRLYLIFSPKVPLSIPFFFFTFKNALLTTLQVYRLAVILHEYREKRIARAKVGAESSLSETLDLGDATAARPDPATELTHHGPSAELGMTASAAASVWFTTRFLHGLGGHGQQLRHRKHVGIQTELSPPPSDYGNNDFYQQTVTDTQSGHAAIKEASSLDSGFNIDSCEGENDDKEPTAGGQL